MLSTRRSLVGNSICVKLTELIVLSAQNRSAIFINESGLYSLVLSSKLCIATSRADSVPLDEYSFVKNVYDWFMDVLV